MKLLLSHCCWTICLLGFASVARGQACEPTPERHAVRIGNAYEQAVAQVAGNDDYFHALENGWVFALVRIEHGWAIRLYEHDRIGEAADLTALTPPHRGVPNPRDIAGWHFRNTDNTAPNGGEVNAPQSLRAFVISPGLQGTAGPRLSDVEPQRAPEDGIGWLKIVDYGLANPKPGTQARMNFLAFEACLSWPRSPEEIALIQDESSLDYTLEDTEVFASCGLPMPDTTMNAHYLPRSLGGDIDGDDTLDLAAQVQRLSDGARGIALCRAGNQLTVLGLGAAALDDLRPRYIDQLEAWHWIDKTQNVPRHLAGVALPEADGDWLILERIEKEAIAIYWHNGRLRAKQLYRYVEP